MEEEKKYKDIELRSEEVQEVMNHISPWVVRCGITVLALILLMILVGCWIFRYPDTLAAEVTLATEEPPAFVLSHATGKLDTLYVKNGSLVSTDADLGVIGNAASSEDVRFLKERMKAWEAQDYDWREGVEFFAGTCALSFGAAAGCFATASGDTAANTLARLLGQSLEFVVFHLLISFLCFGSCCRFCGRFFGFGANRHQTYFSLLHHEPNWLYVFGVGCRRMASLDISFNDSCVF